VKVFDAYASYYDLLYRDKDYAGESTYVLDLLAQQGIRGGQLLELGCGTGRHAEQFGSAGFRVHGIDLSEKMVARAEERLRTSGAGHCFEVGDVRTLQLGQEFDAVVALFHVISYQCSNSDLESTFATTAAHLRRGGAFVFDFWYGPGVLSDRPRVRVKEMSDEVCGVLRIAEPRFLPNDNCVDVQYRMLVTDHATGALHRIEETHRMRYLFFPELLHLAADHGLRITGAYAGQTRKPLGFDAWTGTLVATKT
jgi:SAM-dependent methyltransferase